MPLRYLFVDMNAYFASVEQQDDPKLRYRPVAVVPMMAETTCCLAVSYEGKAKGVKTGTPVWEARQKCPGIVFRVGRHDRYVEVHHGIVKAVGSSAIQSGERQQLANQCINAPGVTLHPLELRAALCAW